MGLNLNYRKAVMNTLSIEGQIPTFFTCLRIWNSNSSVIQTLPYGCIRENINIILSTHATRMVWSIFTFCHIYIYTYDYIQLLNDSRDMECFNTFVFSKRHKRCTVNWFISKKTGLTLKEAYCNYTPWITNAWKRKCEPNFLALQWSV